MQETLAKAW